MGNDDYTTHYKVNSAMILITAIWFLMSTCKAGVVATYHGKASYYADSFHHQKTASGELYDTSLYTAAHLDFSFGQQIRVTSKDNGKSVIVRINDRGPFNKRRIVDLSKAAAKEIGMLDAGIITVRLEVIAE
ncbi:MAG: septal ring lytic transglycosylase RlpA family protein [Saprospiraceae bacterium]|nr:septal ring lytic transglycosylase RlpA family protein [Saprospiraceae bacterium]